MIASQFTIEYMIIGVSTMLSDITSTRTL